MTGEIDMRCPIAMHEHWKVDAVYVYNTEDDQSQPSLAPTYGPNPYILLCKKLSSSIVSALSTCIL